MTFGRRDARRDQMARLRLESSAGRGGWVVGSRDGLHDASFLPGSATLMGRVLSRILFMC